MDNVFKLIYTENGSVVFEVTGDMVNVERNASYIIGSLADGGYNYKVTTEGNTVTVNYTCQVTAERFEFYTFMHGETNLVDEW